MPERKENEAPEGEAVREGRRRVNHHTIRVLSEDNHVMLEKLKTLPEYAAGGLNGVLNAALDRGLPGLYAEKTGALPPGEEVFPVPSVPAFSEEQADMIVDVLTHLCVDGAAMRDMLCTLVNVLSMELRGEVPDPLVLDAGLYRDVPPFLAGFVRDEHDRLKNGRYGDWEKTT